MQSTNTPLTPEQMEMLRTVRPSLKYADELKMCLSQLPPERHDGFKMKYDLLRDKTDPQKLLDDERELMEKEVAKLLVAAIEKVDDKPSEEGEAQEGQGNSA